MVLNKIALLLAILVTFGVGSGSVSGQTPMMTICDCLDNYTRNCYILENSSGTLNQIDRGNLTCPYGCIENASSYGDDCRNVNPNDPLLNWLSWLGVMAGAGVLWSRRTPYYKLLASIFVMAMGFYAMYMLMTFFGVLPVFLGLLMFVDAMQRINRGY